MTRDKVGFGEPTKGKATTTSNQYVRVTTIPRDGGFDLVVEIGRAHV